MCRHHLALICFFRLFQKAKANNHRKTHITQFYPLNPCLSCLGCCFTVLEGWRNSLVYNYAKHTPNHGFNPGPGTEKKNNLLSFEPHSKFCFLSYFSPVFSAVLTCSFQGCTVSCCVNREAERIHLQGRRESRESKLKVDQGCDSQRQTSCKS